MSPRAVHSILRPQRFKPVDGKGAALDQVPVQFQIQPFIVVVDHGLIETIRRSGLIAGLLLQVTGGSEDPGHTGIAAEVWPLFQDHDVLHARLTSP